MMDSKAIRKKTCKYFMLLQLKDLIRPLPDLNRKKITREKINTSEIV